MIVSFRMLTGSGRRQLLVVSTLLTVLAAVKAVPCHFESGASYNKADIEECFNTAPANATVVQNTIDLLQFVVDQYSFTGISKRSAPPYNLEVDLKIGLNALRNPNLFSRDYDFHDAVGRLFNRLHDGHTHYTKPECYAFTMIQPLVVAVEARNGAVQRAVFMPLSFMGADATDNAGLSAYVGSEILEIDGQRAIPAVADHANSDAVYASSQDQGIRFTEQTEGLKFVYRPLQRAALPSKSEITYTLRLNDSSIVDVNIEWQFFPQFNSTNTSDWMQHCQPVPQTLCNVTRHKASDNIRPFLRTPHLSRVDDIRIHSLDTLKKAFGPPDPMWHKQLRRGRRPSSEILMRFLDHPDIVNYLSVGELKELNRIGLGIHHAVDEGAASVLEEHYDTLGVGIYQIPASQLPSQWLGARGLKLSTRPATYTVYRLATFLPPGVMMCQKNLSPCPSEEEMKKANECAERVYDEEKEKLYEARANVTSGTFGQLVLDVSDNGGGSVSLAIAAAVVLDPSITKPNPWKTVPPFDIAYSEAMDEMLSFMDANDISTGSSLDMEGYIYENRMPINETKGAWYRSGRVLSRGGSPRRFSALFSLISGDHLDEVATKYAGERLTPETLTVLTNGMCGSACAEFMHLIQAKRVGTVVQSGGLVRYSSDTKSFSGGAIFGDGTSGLTKAYAELQLAGFNFSSKVSAPPSMPTSASLGFTWLEIYPLQESPASDQTANESFQTPLQFFREPGNARIFYWGVLPPNYNKNQEAATVAYLLQKHCPNTPPISGTTSVASVVSLLAAAAVAVVKVAVYQG